MQYIFLYFIQNNEINVIICVLKVNNKNISNTQLLLHIFL